MSIYQYEQTNWKEIQKDYQKSFFIDTLIILVISLVIMIISIFSLFNKFVYNNKILAYILIGISSLMFLYFLYRLGYYFKKKRKFFNSPVIKLLYQNLLFEKLKEKGFNISKIKIAVESYDLFELELKIAQTFNDYLYFELSLNQYYYEYNFKVSDDIMPLIDEKKLCPSISMYEKGNLDSKVTFDILLDKIKIYLDESENCLNNLNDYVN